MSILTLHRNQAFKLSIPYWVFINEQPVVVMQQKEMSIQMPDGEYNLGIRVIFGLPKWQLYIGGSKKITLTDNQQLHLKITDKERWWNILFDIDLVFCIVKFFISFSNPWNIIYEIISNGFFILWIIRILLIRKNYFKIVNYTEL